MEIRDCQADPEVVEEAAVATWVAWVENLEVVLTLVVFAEVVVVDVFIRAWADDARVTDDAA